MNTVDQSGKVRVRFAPSPTGFLHIGSLRTALFNFLFARHHKGDFLVRVEDTDRQRFTQEHNDAIVHALQWAGIEADEPFIFQHERQNIHHDMVEKLIAEGKAYKCYCSQELLQQKRESAQSNQETFSYDKLCRAVQGDDNQPYVVRFKMPDDLQTLDFHDLIRGKIIITQEHLDDFIIMRSDGSITYNFAVVIDDAFMKITHVIRGEDHIVNTGKQIALYQAFGYQVPHFAHLPLILSATGQKLSKRDTAVAVSDYKDQGVLADALCNYLVRLGWSHGDQEIFSKKEMINLFDLDHVGRKGAIFDTTKLLWINSVHIKNSDAQSLIACIDDNLQIDLQDQCHGWSEQQLLQVVDLYKDRSQTLHALIEQIKGLYAMPESYDQESYDKWIDQQTKNILQSLQAKIGKGAFQSDSVKQMIAEVVQEYGIKFPKIAQPIRLALLGIAQGPGVVDMIMIIGKKETVQRISKFCQKL